MQAREGAQAGVVPAGPQLVVAVGGITAGGGGSIAAAGDDTYALLKYHFLVISLHLFHG